MSTYTDLHLRKKENLTILRMPGNPYDGMTPQRVIFANPENIYNGRFIGQLSTTSVTFDNVTMTNCNVIGGVLSDVAFKIGTSSEIMLTDLTSDINQMSGNVEDLLDFQVSVNASCDSFSTNISFLSNHINTLETSATWLSGYANALSNALTSISGNSGNMSSYISDEICALASVDNSLCTSISGLSNEVGNLSVETNRRIDDIQIQVAGGLVYKGSLSIDLFATTSEFPLSSLFWSNGIAADASLSTGWLFIAQTQPNNKENHYVYGGVTFEHGDWLIVKHDSVVSNITSADVDVFDAQDYDTFKLSEDNAATGSNIFAGRTSFISSAIFNGDVSLNGNTSVNGNIAFYSPSVEFLNDVTVDKNLITRYLESNNAEFKNLSINLGETKYKGGLCSLQDLSDEIYTTLSTHSQSISSIDDQLLSINNKISTYDTELSNHMRYYGSFTDYRYENISTFLDTNVNLLSDSIIENGSMFRFNQTMTLSDATSSISFFENDYIVCNKDVKLGHIQLSDFDFIRDAEAEVKQLSNDVYDLLSLKQDKLLDEQISAIDSVVDDRQTIIDFGNGDISTFNWTDYLSRGNFYDIGIYSDDGWIKSPINVKIGSAINTVGVQAFLSCENLKNVIMSDGVLDIRSQAFRYCNNLSTVVFGKNIKIIGTYAFSETGIKNLIIPNSVEEIEYNAFDSCNELIAVKIGSNVINIGKYAFANCHKLADIIILDGVINTGAQMFINCDSLSSVSLPNTIRNINTDTFKNCNKLSNIVLPSNLINIGNSFKDCSSLTNIIIPNGVKTINASNIFGGCINLSTIYIPNSIESIGSQAFNNSNEYLSIFFKDKSAAQISSMAGYPWKALSSQIYSWNDASQEWVSANFQVRGDYLTSIPSNYKTYDDTVSSLSNDGYVRNVDVISKDELRQTLSSIASDSALTSLTLTSNFENIVSSVVKVRDILSSLYETLN